MEKLSMKEYMKQSTEASEAYINLFEEMDQICQDMRDKIYGLLETYTTRFKDLDNKYADILINDYVDQTWFDFISEKDVSRLETEYENIHEYLEAVDDILDMWKDLRFEVTL